MPSHPMTRILITGACGQIGTELTAALRERHGGENVIATDIQSPPPGAGRFGAVRTAGHDPARCPGRAGEPLSR